MLAERENLTNLRAESLVWLDKIDLSFLVSDEFRMSDKFESYRTHFYDENFKNIRSLCHATKCILLLQNRE